MKTLAFAAATAFAFSAAAFADTLENAAGNTVNVTNAEGATVRYHFDADHSFMMMTPDNQMVHGAWSVADGQICLTPTGGEPGCTDYVGDKNVGDSWTQRGIDGTQITVSVTAGR